jgi:hypothetical protein
MSDESSNPELSPQDGVQYERFGPPGPSRWLCLRKDVSANESVPSSHHHGVRIHKGELVVWAVVVPATRTALTVHLGRWITCTDKKAEVDGYAEEHTHAETPSAAKVYLYEQYVDGDPLCCFIDGLAGTGDIDILYKVVNRPKSP